MKANYERAMRVVNAAVAVLDIEARWNATGRASGATAAKRELEAAVSDYIDHADARASSIFPSTRRTEERS